MCVQDADACWWLIQTHVLKQTPCLLLLLLLYLKHPMGDSGTIILTLPPSVHSGTTVGCTTARGNRMRGKTEGSPISSLHTSANERQFNFVPLLWVVGRKLSQQVNGGKTHDKREERDGAPIWAVALLVFLPTMQCNNTRKCTMCSVHIHT